ncbi:hypothetical protein FHETE_1357 [Fusarium heterosporum]|uniref:Uncharacterized protein n=1 Tax=Fusarium heterosporum TaxID=42747 RepID=A0A8H5U1H9_FUSHE|nr:hypothetical protein FHETE_1357 [Fusarium heterosporum]
MTSNEWKDWTFERILTLNAEHIRKSSKEGPCVEPCREPCEKPCREPFDVPWQPELRHDCETKEDTKTLLELTKQSNLLLFCYDGWFRGRPQIKDTDSNGLRGIPVLEFIVAGDSKVLSFIKRLLYDDRLDVCAWNAHSGKAYEGGENKPFNAIQTQCKDGSWKGGAGPPSPSTVLTLEDYNLEDARALRTLNVYICIIGMKLSLELYTTEKEEDFNNAIRNFNLAEIVVSHKRIADLDNDDGDIEEHPTNAENDSVPDGEPVGLGEQWMYHPFAWKIVDFEDILALNVRHIKDSSHEYQASLYDREERPVFHLPWAIGFREDCDSKDNVDILTALTEQHKLLVIANAGHFRGRPHRHIYHKNSEGGILSWKMTRGIPIIEFLILKDLEASVFVKRLHQDDRLDVRAWEGRSGDVVANGKAFPYRKYRSMDNHWRNKEDFIEEDRDWGLEDYGLNDAEIFQDGCDPSLEDTLINSNKTDVYICVVGMKIADSIFMSEENEQFNNAIKNFDLIDIIISHKRNADSGGGKGE